MIFNCVKKFVLKSFGIWNRCANATINLRMRRKLNSIELGIQTTMHPNNTLYVAATTTTAAEACCLRQHFPHFRKCYFAWLVDHKWKSMKASIESLIRKWNSQILHLIYWNFKQFNMHEWLTFMKSSTMHAWTSSKKERERERGQSHIVMIERRRKKGERTWT